MAVDALHHVETFEQKPSSGLSRAGSTGVSTAGVMPAEEGGKSRGGMLSRQPSGPLPASKVWQCPV